MLALALGATLVAFVLLILGLVTGTVWLAITCIVVCLAGLGFLIADVVGSGRRAPSRSVEQMVGSSASGRRAGSITPLADDTDADDEAVDGVSTSVRHRPGGPRGAARSGSVPAQPRAGAVPPSAAPAWNDAAESGPRKFADIEEPAAREPGVRASGPGNASTQRLGAPTAGPSAVGSTGQTAVPPGLGLNKQPEAAGYSQPTPPSAPRQQPGRPAGGYDDYLRSVGGLPEAPQQRPAPPQNPAASRPETGRSELGRPESGFSEPGFPEPGFSERWGSPPQSGRMPQQPRPQYQPPAGPQGQFGPSDGPGSDSQEIPRPWSPSGPPNQPGQSGQSDGGTPPVTGRRRKIDPLDPEWRPGS